MKIGLIEVDGHNNYTIFKTTPDFYKYDPKRG